MNASRQSAFMREILLQMPQRMVALNTGEFNYRLPAQNQVPVKF
jgi:hypothetical protein